MPKVLVIDDEITLNDPLGRNMKEFFEEYNYDIIFTNTWEDEEFGPKAKDVLKEGHKDIDLILLDISFPKQTLEGGEIFEKLKKSFTNIPVAILTVKNSYTEYREFVNRGGKNDITYIVKQDFKYISDELKEILPFFIAGPENKNLTLVLEGKKEGDCYFDIKDKNGKSLLKRKKSLSPPVEYYILECIRNPERTADIKCIPKDPKGPDNVYDKTKIHKKINQFNRRIRKSSKKRISKLLDGLDHRGNAAFKLLIGKVEDNTTN